MATADEKRQRRQAIRELNDAHRDLDRISHDSFEETDAHRAAHQRLADAEQAAKDAGVPWWRR